MFNKGATAVVCTSPHCFFLSIREEGIYSFINGVWKFEYPLSFSIFHFRIIGDYLFGVGDNGKIIRYNLKKQIWTEATFPTVQRLWDIAGNNHGLIVTHSGSQLLFSENFGKNWIVIKPFKKLQSKPIIRSLSIFENAIYIGTQIHKECGGLWKYCLLTKTLTRIKEEQSMMISAIYVDKEIMCIAKGACSSNNGCIEVYMNRNNQLIQWKNLHSPMKENAFLDIFFSKGNLYVCSSKGVNGYSTIYYCDVRKEELIPMETIRGHCYRAAYAYDELMLAGAEESKWIALKTKTEQKIH
ncbi:MAG: hypothetical protein ABF649_14260 [Bacillus sp. (in: firmicutes)]